MGEVRELRVPQLWDDSALAEDPKDGSDASVDVVERYKRSRVNLHSNLPSCGTCPEDARDDDCIVAEIDCDKVGFCVLNELANCRLEKMSKEEVRKLIIDS